MAFSGIQIVEPAIFKYIKQTGKFSIIDLYLKLAKDHIIKGFLHDDDFWLDIGTPEKLKNAEKSGLEFLNL